MTLPSADTGVLRVSSQDPPEQVAVAGVVPAPSMSGVTVSRSPSAVPHAPPIEVTAALVRYGKTRVAPFTLVTVTTGAVVSAATVTVLLTALVAVQDR